MASESKSIFSDTQLETLLVIADTFIASLDDKSANELVVSASQLSSGSLSPVDVQRYGKISWTSLGITQQLLHHAPLLIPPNKLSDLTFSLSLLSTRLGTLALTGHFTEFRNLTMAQREAALLAWSTSSVPLLRQLFRAFSGLTVWLAYVQTGSPLKKAIGYPGPDPEARSEKFRANALPPYEFVQVPPEGLDIECDVVVVGSGAGGGVVAAELARAGKRVVVLEKGRYYRPEEITTDELKGSEMHEKGSPFSTDGAEFFVLAGSTFGGGTTVNWCASLQPQHFVREQWSAQGLPYFATPRFQQHLDRVYKRIGATKDSIVHNVPNQILMDGCRSLGYHVDVIPQNTAGRAHQCGWCCFGCPYGQKQGTVATWLDDARRAGARFVEQCFVERVVVRDGVAKGVEAVVGEGEERRRLVVKAAKVVVAGGALNSPGVLTRSGLKNRMIGKNLWLHPATVVFGVFPDRLIECYKGSIMTAAKLEVPSLHPAWMAPMLPWSGSFKHKELMLHLNHICPILVLVRDKDSRGTVSYNPDGSCRLDYAMSPHDRRSMLEGVVRALDVLVAAGAQEVFTVQNGVEPFTWRQDEERGIAGTRYRTWIEERVRKSGLLDNRTGFFTAHQMGTW
ncbi:GMC oxidoreductase-domain-containing protein [Jimgerdemannia flammicorona]|uniref:Long-chain-alcohol oxidase n=1 Tax=Jimgerdemannia flammicorona TaxID=994334 RepID=A0A433DDB8_9FUNG|nr:GMC oxidoreductase-domain-containing protein [Jimgerdemannia flammicorona]